MPLSQRRAPRLLPVWLTLFLGAVLPLHSQAPPTPTGLPPDIEEHEMTEGKIPVLNLLKFLQDTTGKLVNFPSTTAEQPFLPDVTVEVLGDITPLSLPIVRAILETNGYELWEEELDDGSMVINVRSNAVRTPTPSSPTTPIIEKGQGTPTDNMQELATLVLQLKYTETAATRRPRPTARRAGA